MDTSDPQKRLKTHLMAKESTANVFHQAHKVTRASRGRVLGGRGQRAGQGDEAERQHRAVDGFPRGSVLQPSVVFAGNGRLQAGIARGAAGT